MNESGLSFLNIVGGLLTHSFNDSYEFSEFELKEIDRAISILLKVRDDFENKCLKSKEERGTKND